MGLSWIGEIEDAGWTGLASGTVLESTRVIELELDDLEFSRLWPGRFLPNSIFGSLESSAQYI